MYSASWSGGKDSCLACYNAIRKGIGISHLIHFERENNLHGVSAELIRLQAELAGIPIVQRRIVSDDFESEFKETVNGIGNIQGMVFGDIYLKEHRSWIERVCREIGVEALLPIWGIDTEKIMIDLIDEGFDAVVVSGRQEIIDKEWIGHKVDTDFMDYLKSRQGVDICGENGEYHTFVLGGPLFNGRIEITEAGTTERDGHWFLDLQDFRVV